MIALILKGTARLSRYDGLGFTNGSGQLRNRLLFFMRMSMEVVRR